MKDQARNVYMAIVSAVGFFLFANSLIHFNFSKTPETLILALYYFISTYFMVMIFRKNFRLEVTAPIDILCILILGTQGAISFVIGLSIGNFRNWKRKLMSPSAAISNTLHFVPGIYLGNFIFHVFEHNAKFNLGIFVTSCFFIVYSFCLTNALNLFFKKIKIDFSVTLLNIFDNIFVIIGVFIYRIYLSFHIVGLLMMILPYSGFVMLLRSLVNRYFERDEFISALAISSELIQSRFDLDGLIHRIADKLQKVFEASSVEIFLKNNGYFNLTGHSGNSPWKETQPDPNFINEVWNNLTLVPTTVYDSKLSTRSYEPYRRLNAGSVLIIPLVSEGDCIGFILCSSYSIFDPSHEFFAAKLTPQLISAIIAAQLYDKLIEALKELRETKRQVLHFEKLASIGQLASGIAHEFNTPLNSLLIQAETLIENYQKLPENLRVELIEETYRVFESEIQRLSGLVDGLRSFSKNVNNGEIWSYIDIKIQFEELLRSFEQRSGRIKFRLDFPSELPQLWCNLKQINQLFTNIVLNAIQAIQGEGNIWITAFLENDKFIISIRDNGTGIPKQHQNRIFDPFFTTRNIGEGTGLGLSIAYGIIERHSGEISFESEEGVGTTFYITFPQSQLLYLKEYDKSGLISLEKGEAL